MKDVIQNNKRLKGSKYEHVAGEYLKSMGFEIIQYNFYSKHGEIDIIALDNEYLVFCEVKYRSSGRKFNSLRAVDKKKQKRIINCARFYIWENKLKNVPCRFDVVGIEGEEIFYIKNAFSI